MSKYIKRKDITTLEFQPLDKEARKEFKIWDNTEHKFYKDGDVVPFEAGSKTLGEAGTKIPVEEKVRFRWAVSCIREVLVDGETKVLDLPPTCDEMLQKVMDKEPNCLNFTYTVERTGTGLATKYMIYKEQEVGTVGAHQSRIEEEQDFSRVNGVILNQGQADLIKALREKMVAGNVNTEDDNAKNIAVTHLKENGFTEELANQTYEEHLK